MIEDSIKKEAEASCVFQFFDSWFVFCILYQADPVDEKDQTQNTVYDKRLHFTRLAAGIYKCISRINKPYDTK